jgi:hypothetical protein
MALGRRAQGDINTMYGDSFRVIIWEEGFSGTVIDLLFYSPGFSLQYHPTSSDISSPIIPSSVELYVENPDDGTTDIDDLLFDLLGVQQTDFFIEIQKSTGGPFTNYWFGVVLQDEVTAIEDAKPRLAKITATDGLALLKTFDYDNVNTVSATVNNPSHTKVLDIIYNCLSQAVDVSLWDPADNYLITSDDFWETDQTYSATGDPLADLGIDVIGFREVKTGSRAQLFNGQYGPEIIEVDYLSCWDVLEQLALTRFARVYQFNGAWHFEQISLRAAATTKRMRYTKSIGTPTYSKPNTYTTLDGTLKKRRLAMNQTTYLPALKRVEVEQRAYGTNFDPRLFFSADNLSNTADRTFGLYSDEYYTSAAGTQVSQAFFFQIQFLNRFAYAAANNYNSWYLVGNRNSLQLRCKIDLEIKLSDAYSSTVYYWDGNQWQTTAAVTTVYSQTNVLSIGGGKNAATYNTQIPDFGTRVINTGYLPCTGVLEVTIDNLGFQNYHGNQGQSGGIPYQWSDIASGSISNLKGGIVLNVKTLLEASDTAFLYAVSNPNTSINDNEIYTYPTFLIGDKTTQSGHYLYDNGSSVESCELWEVGNGGGQDIPLAALVAQRRLLIQSEAVKRYEGTITFTEGYGEGIAFDSEFYLPHDYNFDAWTGEVRGTWYKISEYITAGDPSEDPSDPFTSTEAAGRQAGNINTLLNILETKARGIDYDEANDLIQVNGRLESPSGVKRKTEVETAEDGLSMDLSKSNHKILITWSGTAGTFTINLPSVEDGTEFVIILDGTFTGSQTVTLNPDGSETINGESTEDLTASGRHVIEAANDQWFTG